MPDPALLRFRTLINAGLTALEERRQEVNDLNVFPVADGDTGDNMALTMRAVLDELDRLASETGDRTIDEIGRDEIVTSVARAALLGARGNSGVILSQIIRGAAAELISRPGELIDPALIGAAFSRGSAQAYSSVREPTEGTILTVVRAMSTQLSSDLAHVGDLRLPSDATDEQQNMAAAFVLSRALAAGEESVKRGPDLLPVLRAAGVVDAGGYGLTVIFAGMLAALKGEDTISLAHHSAARISHPEHSSTSFRYCTNFAVTGDELNQSELTEQLELLGDSLLVVGDETMLKIHVHTDEPERAMALFAGFGEISRVEVADMTEQVRERDSRLDARTTAKATEITTADGEHLPTRVVAVSTGDGLHDLFDGLGVTVLDGGVTLNPSTSDLLAAINATNSDEVVLLPNSSNVFMAAERAAELSERPVLVVQTRSLQAGLAAAFVADSRLDAAANVAKMNDVIAELRTGGVAPAARADLEGRFAIGDAIGFVDGELVVWGTPEHTLKEVLERLSEDAELVTCLRGIEAPLTDDEVTDLAGELELELAEGGQSSYWWLLSAE